MTYFSRHGNQLPITRIPADYKPGDIVCWNLGGGTTHIGLVVNKKLPNSKNHLIVHNIGAGQVLSDCLFGRRLDPRSRPGCRVLLLLQL